MTERKPKILYAVEGLSGGKLTYLINLSDRLIDKYDITIAYSPDSDTPQNVRKLFDKRISVRILRSLGKDGNLFKDAEAKNEIKSVVEEEKPDIVHLHGYRAGQIGRKALDGAKGIAVFYTPHGYRFLAEDHNRLVRSMYRSNEAGAAKTDAMTIACSKGEFAETLAFTDNAAYVNNGIDTREIDEMTKDIVPADHPFTVFTSGRINEQKNPALFNEIAMAMPDVKFRWIGDGGLNYKLVAPNIEITGWKDRKEALRLAKESDVFILTSLWEGLPISLLEAMYLKKFCIVSNVVGSRDVVENGENGYVCDTAAAFVNAINHAQGEKAQQMIDTAYQDIMENYTVDQMAEKYDKIYQSKLSR